MDISVSDFLAEVDREYSGLTFTDVEGSPLTLRSALRLGNDTLKHVDQAQNELARMQRAAEEDGADLDYDRASGLLVDVLALAADRPDALRRLVDGWDMGTLRALVAKWQKDTQGEAPAQ